MAFIRRKIKGNGEQMENYTSWKEIGRFTINDPTANSRNLRCWANSHECSNQMTKEHVISDSILKYFKKMTIELGDRTIHASSKSYTIKCLCSYHNNALSACDNEALKLFSGWKRITTDDPTGIRHQDALRNHINIDIKLIERWFAKTFINRIIFKLISEKPRPNILAFDATQVARKIFSTESFQPPFGVYQRNAEKPILTGRKAWSFGDGFTTTRQFKSNGAEKDYRIPSVFCACLGGVELIGFFNITQFTDEHALKTFLGPVAENLQKNGCYREAINFAGHPRTIRNKRVDAPIGSVIFVNNDNLEHPTTKGAIAAIRDGMNIKP